MVLLQTTPILRSNFSRVILKNNLPVMGRREQDWRPLAMYVVKIQPDPPLAFPIRLGAVLAIR